MTKKKISEAVSNISTRHIEEAADYSEKRQTHKPIWTKLGVIAACLVLVLAISGILSQFNGGVVVAAYAYETNEEITAEGAVIDTGTIRDNGEMTGHPLMFYLSGEDIETVRFSCKNQQINFIDWTEKRDEYGNAQNFTVTYGEDEREYYYLTIDWVPNTIIRELTDNSEATIATLPTEMREDIIVMEITFKNGKTATKAITISLLDNGTFFATFDDYEISEADTFVKRPDSEYISQDIHSPDSEMINNKTEASDEAAENTITFDGTIIENTIDTLAYVILVEPSGNKIPYEAVFFELPEQEADWVLRIGEEVTITCLDTFTEQAPHFGTLISITEQVASEEQDDYAEAEKAARAYYANTVFEVISMELKEQTADEISFSVCVSKGGVVQDPNRTIFLQLVNGSWQVVNEGY